MKTTITTIVGSASESVWSQAHSVTLGEQHQLLVVLQLKCLESDSLIDLVTVGSEILAEVESQGRGVNDLVKLKRMVEHVTGGVGAGIEISLLVGVVINEQFLVFGKGEVQAYLVRGGQMAKLTQGEGDKPGVAGQLMVGDKILLASTGFVMVAGLDKVREILVNEDNPSEVLIPLVHTKGETNNVAAVVGVITGEKLHKGWPQLKLNLHSTEPRRMNLWIGLTLLVLLILMIGVGMVRRVRVMAEQNYNELSVSVNSKIDEALQVGELNPEQARVLLSQAKGELEAYLESDVRDEYKTKARQLMAHREQAELKAFKANSIELSTVVELNVLASGLQAGKMKTDGKNKLIFLDEKEGRVVEMSIVDRSRRIVEFGVSENIMDIGVFENKVFGLHMGGVKEFVFDKKEDKTVIEADQFWVEPSEIEMFAGNIYVLDQGQSEIWKYSTLGDRFGARSRWFAVGIEPDLSNVVDMKIGGDIWLLTSSGKLERYSRGAPVNFLMEGFPAKGESKRFSDPIAMWVGESYVYVLERGAERVVRFSIEGKFDGQYVNSDFAKASDLVVIDSKGYVLIDNAVKEFGL